MINTPYVTKANSKSRALECGFVLRSGPDREWRRRERISGWLCQTSWFSRPRVEIHTGTLKTVWQGRGLFLHSRMTVQTLDVSKEMPCLRDRIRNFQSPEEWDVRRTCLTVLQSMGGTETVQTEQFLKMGPCFKLCRLHLVVRSRGWLSYRFWTSVYYRLDMLPSPQEDTHGHKSTRPAFLFFIILFTYFCLCCVFIIVHGFLEWWLPLLLSMSSSSFSVWAQELLFPRSRAQLPQLWHLALVAPRHMGSSWARDWTCVFHIDRQVLLPLSSQGSPKTYTDETFQWNMETSEGASCWREVLTFFTPLAWNYQVCSWCPVRKRTSLPFRIVHICINMPFTMLYSEWLSSWHQTLKGPSHIKNIYCTKFPES